METDRIIVFINVVFYYSIVLRRSRPLRRHGVVPAPGHADSRAAYNNNNTNNINMTNNDNHTDHTNTYYYYIVHADGDLAICSRNVISDKPLIVV